MEYKIKNKFCHPKIRKIKKLKNEKKKQIVQSNQLIQQEHIDLKLCKQKKTFMLVT